MIEKYISPLFLLLFYYNYDFYLSISNLLKFKFSLFKFVEISLAFFLINKKKFIKQNKP